MTLPETDDIADDGAPSATGAPRPAGDDGLDAKAADWQPLPRAARNVFMASGFLTFLLAAIGAQIPLGLLLPWDGLKMPLGATVLVALPAFGLWLGAKQYRYTGWRLGRDGFALRRGRLWQVETVVPVNRVQHVDLKRGPLERRFGLATLVVHTAGTENSAVSAQGLGHDDALKLRDHLARRLDDDDDDDA